MLLKGYGVSLDYPIPAHRPCGDIDIWLFGQQEHADALLHREKGTAINLEKHHHTVFSLDGITVENHYDFLNVHAHASNREIEKKLQELAAEPEKKYCWGKLRSISHPSISMRSSCSAIQQDILLLKNRPPASDRLDDVY